MVKVLSFGLFEEVETSFEETTITVFLLGSPFFRLLLVSLFLLSLLLRFRHLSLLSDVTLHLLNWKARFAVPKLVQCTFLHSPLHCHPHLRVAFSPSDVGIT